MKYPLLAGLVFFTGAMFADDFTTEPGFTALCNGRDLTGWHHQDGPALDGLTDAGDGRFTLADGAITGNGDKAAHGRVLLWTAGQYTGNFVLRFEFRAAPKTDGGIFFNQTQLQCGDYHNYAYRTFAHYKPEDWNAIEVTLQDGVARCTCNGELLEAALKIPAPGAIGLEVDKNPIAYRRLRIKRLP
jgi:hypothetical protein